MLIDAFLNNEASFRPKTAEEFERFKVLIQVLNLSMSPSFNEYLDLYYDPKREKGIVGNGLPRLRQFSLQEFENEIEGLRKTWEPIQQQFLTGQRYITPLNDEDRVEACKLFDAKGYQTLSGLSSSQIWENYSGFCSWLLEPQPDGIIKVVNYGEKGGNINIRYTVAFFKQVFSYNFESLKQSKMAHKILGNKYLLKAAVEFLQSRGFKNDDTNITNDAITNDSIILQYEIVKGFHIIDAARAMYVHTSEDYQLPQDWDKFVKDITARTSKTVQRSITVNGMTIDNSKLETKENAVFRIADRDRVVTQQEWDAIKNVFNRNSPNFLIWGLKVDSISIGCTGGFTRDDFNQIENLIEATKKDNQ